MKIRRCIPCQNGYDHLEAACYNKQAEEAKSRTHSQNTQNIQILKKEFTTPVEQEKKSVIYVQEELIEIDDAEVLMRCLSTKESVQIKSPIRKRA